MKERSKLKKKRRRSFHNLNLTRVKTKCVCVFFFNHLIHYSVVDILFNKSQIFLVAHMIGQDKAIYQYGKNVLLSYNERIISHRTLQLPVAFTRFPKRDHLFAATFSRITCTSRTCTTNHLWTISRSRLASHRTYTTST